ncbi:MAG: hypothetical protein Q9227_006906 [Pyrenula ochraceoflavens]
MFNRNNYPSVPNPFGGARPDGSPRPPPRDPYASNQGGPAPQRKSNYDNYSQSQYDMQPGTTYDQPPPQRNMAGNVPARRPPPSKGGSKMALKPAKSPGPEYFFRNLVAVSPSDFNRDLLLLVDDKYVVSAQPCSNFPPGSIGLSDVQRQWMQVALTDVLRVEGYDPFSQGGQAYLGDMDIEVAFATIKKREETPYDQDELAKLVIRAFDGQVFAPGQRFMMDVRNVPLKLCVRNVQVVDLSEKGASKGAPTSSDPLTRGLLTQHTNINFFKDPKEGVNLKGSNRRPAASAIVRPDFNFNSLGIGGLDVRNPALPDSDSSRFSTIFRRAFASRIFPPGLVDKLGIQHVKGILLYGPPGTGKTLIARQIGKMLNAREPKVINGPEVLNKYVGQSEENIRKLFADAEKEYKEKGDESGLHIIIFDELDAVCKQRGSGSSGGTGVGDSVVNQLLSKLDGVDQLNIPDEKGRMQILTIHTNKMRENKVLDNDVSLDELARLTKNFSGAEIGGLVKSASSYAFQRHVKVGTMAGVSDDVADMKVNRQDFHNALDEVKAAFGVSEEELANAIHGGIIPYSEFIDNILAEGKLFVEQVRKPDSTPLFSVLLHGPPGSGKTALAAKIALDSGFPFVKLLSPEDMIGFNEMAKIQHLTKVFMDAYKSPMSVIVMDNIERIVDWTPVGPRFSNSVLQTVIVLLRKFPQKGRRLLILATTTERSVLQQLDVFNSFDSDIPVPNVMSYQQLEYIMEESRAFSPDDIRRGLGEIREMTRSEEVGVGVKKVLLAIETAKQDSDMASRFAGVIARAVAERGYSGA